MSEVETTDLRVSDVKKDVSDLVRLLWSDRVTRQAGYCLLAMVFGIIFVFTVMSLFAERSEIAREIAQEIELGRDGSLSEIVNQGVAFAGALFFFLVFLEHRSRVPLALSSLLLFIFFDDAAEYHERLGEYLVQALDLGALAGLRDQDMGELTAWALAAGALLAVFLWSLRRRLPGDAAILVLVFLAFLSLIFFGLVVDFIHILAPESYDFTLEAIEDGGEMLSVALMTTIAVGVHRNAISFYASRKTAGEDA